MKSLRIAAFALAAALGSGLPAGTASAMPVNGLTPAAAQIADGVQNVAYVCGPYRCWWRPGPYWGGPYWRSGYWGYRPWGWGYRRWGWGWRRRWW